MGQLEIACFNLQSVIIAQQNGADRVELCNGITVGGTTPDYEMVAQARKELSIDLNVMIRPRGGNFVYTKEEFLQMKSEILAFKKLYVDGFVFGILNENGTINIEQNKALVQLTHPFPCTFHRAFDEASSVFDALEEVIDCGFKIILTSGQAPNVMEGCDCLTELVSKANNRIIIMPGGALRSSNISIIQQKTNAHYYHSSAITDGSETANAIEVKALKTKSNL